MSAIDDELKERFNKKVAEVDEVFKKTVWASSSLAGKNAFIALLSEMIPEEFEWVPVITPFGVAVTLVGYSPQPEELLREAKTKTKLN